MTSPLAARLGIELALVQAPMNAISTAPLAAAVSNRGGLGSLGTATMTQAQIATLVQQTRTLTARPFALNFFVHEAPRADDAMVRRMRARLAPYRQELGADDPPQLAVAPPFDGGMLALVLDLRPAVVSFHFGLPEPAAVLALRAAGIRILASATTVAEARQLQDRGVDAVIAQGAEAGGHRATFASPYSEGEIGTMALVPQIVSAVSVPVIAAGGIADGRGIAAALALGAAGVALGTAFLRCPETEIDPIYRRVLSTPRAAHTRITRAFTGRPARAIVNRFVEEMAASEADALPFPLQRALTTPLALAARARDSAEFSPLWAGQAAALARPLPAAELVSIFADEAAAAGRALSSAGQG